jgi:hypothetical protein
MNILQSLISNSLLLAPRIVRTFKKSLTAVDIIEFTEEDENEIFDYRALQWQLETTKNTKAREG